MWDYLRDHFSSPAMHIFILHPRFCLWLIRVSALSKYSFTTYKLSGIWISPWRSLFVPLARVVYVHLNHVSFNIRIVSNYSWYAFVLSLSCFEDNFILSLFLPLSCRQGIDSWRDAELGTLSIGHSTASALAIIGYSYSTPTLFLTRTCFR